MMTQNDQGAASDAAVSNEPNMSTDVRVAFIGAGYMATEHLKAFLDIPHAKPVGVVGRSRSRAEALSKAGAGPVFDSIDELYRATNADVVVISVPELAVRDVSFSAFRHPWVCLIEKPAGYDLDDAVAIAAEAKARMRRAFVALNRRHYGSTRALVSDLATHEGPRLIQIFDQEDQIAARAAQRPELVVRNWMYANSIHLVDYFTVLGRGEITRVDNIVPWTPDDPFHVAARIVFSSGDVGMYQAVWNAPGPWAVTVTTHAKRWELRPVEQLFVQPYGSRRLEPVEADPRDAAFKPGLRVQAGELVKAVRGQPHMLPTLDDALASMRLVRSIYGLERGDQRPQ